MVKIKTTGHDTSVWHGTRYDSGNIKACSEPSMFTEACFRGDDPRRNVAPVAIKAIKAASQFSIVDGTTIAGKAAGLRLHRGGNVWIIGAVDGESLKMAKIRVTGWSAFFPLLELHDSGYQKACAKQPTFLASCFRGKAMEGNRDQVNIVAEKAPSWL